MSAESTREPDGGFGVSRRRGDTVYGAFSLGVFSAETLALGVLTWTFLLRATGVIPDVWLMRTLIGCVASAALALLVLAVFTMAQQAHIERRRVREDAEIESWTQRWMEVLLGGERTPPAPLPASAVASALELRELLKGDEGERLVKLLGDYNVETDLIDQLGSARLSKRLDALEALAKGRLPGAQEGLRKLFSAPQPAVRLMAARAAARTLAVMPGGESRDQEATAFANALEVAELASGIVLEVLLLLDDAAPRTVEFVLGGERSAVILRGAIDAAGRLQLAALAEDISRRCLHTDPEVRASAYRSLGSIGLLPDVAAGALPAALSADAEAVRIQAAHAVHLLPAAVAIPAAWKGMSDVSWWVRLASAGSLLRMGEAGAAALGRVATEHDDRYARGIAAQTLADGRAIDAGAATTLFRAA